MSTSQVDEAWLRIERWLAGNAPGTLASLRPGADPAAVADAQQRLGLRFPGDLVASLQRHDGCEPARGHFTLYGPFRPMTLTELVPSHRETEEVLADSEGYWDRHYLMIAANNSGWGILVDCEPGENHGRVGTWFGGGGGGARWSGWPSLGALLADIAAALEAGRPVDGWVPVAFGGELDWKLSPAPADPAPVSVLTLAAAAAEPVPPLSRPGGPQRPPAGWIGDYSNNSCLTFVENIDPDELLRRFGVGAPRFRFPGRRCR